MSEILKSCKIKIEDIDILFDDGSSITLPSRYINFISIEKNYYENFLPILYIKCLVTEDIYFILNNSNPTYSIDIKKLYVNSDEDNFNKDSSTSVYRSFIKNTFTNVNNDDKSPNLSSDLVKDKISQIDPRPELEQYNREIDLLLFRTDSIDYRTLNSYVFSNCNMSSLITTLYSKTNQSNKLLLSPPDNTNYYEEDILIPNNLTFLGMIKYLQSVYGIYNTGYCLFNDYNLTYLIDKSVNCTAKLKGDLSRVYIQVNEDEADTSKIYGFYKDITNDRYFINSVNTPIININSSEMKSVLFDNLKAVNNGTGKITNKNINMINNNDGVDVVRVVEDKYNNNYIINSIAYEMENNNYSIKMSFPESDLDIFTPNKEFYLDINIYKSEYRKLNGLMSLNKVMATYQKNDDETFIGNIVAEFNRP